MQLIACHNGQLQTLTGLDLVRGKNRTFRTGLAALDELLPGRSLACGAIHEILSDSVHASPRFFALLLAAASLPLPARRESSTPHSLPLPLGGEGRGEGGGPRNTSTARTSKISPLTPTLSPRGERESGGAIVWCDPGGELYPPAVAAAGVPLERLFLLHPKTLADQVWAVAECLRCRGVSATIASAGKLSRIEARRLQLAAERGGGIGLLLRPATFRAAPYAAATRWLVAPCRGERNVQRWKIQLIHGHGGRVGHTVILEHCRETNLVRVSEELADRPAVPQPERVPA